MAKRTLTLDAATNRRLGIQHECGWWKRDLPDMDAWVNSKPVQNLARGDERVKVVWMKLDVTGADEVHKDTGLAWYERPGYIGLWYIFTGFMNHMLLKMNGPYMDFAIYAAKGDGTNWGMYVTAEGEKILVPMAPGIALTIAKLRQQGSEKHVDPRLGQITVYLNPDPAAGVKAALDAMPTIGCSDPNLSIEQHDAAYREQWDKDQKDWDERHDARKAKDIALFGGK